jgi:hypothetical protein
VSLIAVKASALITDEEAPTGQTPGTRDRRLWPFAVDSIWNMPRGTSATSITSGDALTQLRAGAGAVVAEVGSHPVFLATATDPLRTVSTPAGNRSWRIPSSAYLGNPGGYVHVADADSVNMDETAGMNLSTFVAARHARVPLTGPGYATGGIRDYGGPAAGGLIRTHEVDAIVAGASRPIPHALAFALGNAALWAATNGGDPWQWPATGANDNWATTYDGDNKMGTWVFIPSSVDISAQGWSAAGRAVAQALQDYGGYCTDRAVGFTLYVQANAWVDAHADQAARRAAITAMRADIDAIMDQLVIGTGHGPSQVGGSGSRRTTLAPVFESVGSRDPMLWPFSLSPWNRPLGDGAVYSAPGSANTIDAQQYDIGINAGNWSHPIYQAVAANPTYDLYRRTSGGYSVAANFSNQQFRRSFKVPPDAAPASNGSSPTDQAFDGHMHVIDPAKTFVDEMYAAAGGPAGSIDHAGRRISETNGGRFMLHGDGLTVVSGTGQGSRAYKGAGMAGLIRRWELEAGEIRHALACAYRHEQAAPNSFVWPALGTDAQQSGNTGSLPMGALLCIPRTVNLASLGLTAGGLVFATALQRFGAYIVDRNSSRLVFYAEPSCEGMTQLTQMRADGDSAIISNQLVRVTNNSSSGDVAGGGNPLAPLPPALAT